MIDNKFGHIPPHFLKFLEDEEILIKNFKSSNLKFKDEFDKMTVFYPYCNKNIIIEILFDNINNSNPPDFIIINNGNFLIEYNKIIKNWNFRDSSSLYFCLFKIKKEFSIRQEKNFREICEEFRIFPHNKSSFLKNVINIKQKEEILDFCEKILFFIKNVVNEYSKISGIFKVVDIYIEYDEKNKNEPHLIIFSYPLDIYLRSKHIKRMPYVHICIPIDNIDKKFWMELTLPNYISKDYFHFLKEHESLNNFKRYIKGFDNYIYVQIINMNNREEMIKNILNMEIGYPLEIDTRNFESFSLLFIYQLKEIKNGKTKITNKNFILKFLFNNEEKKIFEVQILDTIILTILIRRKINYFNNSDKDKVQIVNLLLSAINKCIKQGKKNKNNNNNKDEKNNNLKNANVSDNNEK